MSTELINDKNILDYEADTLSENKPKLNLDSKNQNNLNNLIPFSKQWRGKLYILNENGQWDDKGIGYVFCANETEGDNTLNGGKQNSNQLVKKLIMIKEKTEEIIFNIDIKKENVDFHNQRGTILTWKKNNCLGEDNNAISFQEKEGILEILRNIKIINGKNISNDDLLSEDTSDAFYDVTVENLPNIVRELGPTMDEEKISDFIDYLKETKFYFIKKLGKILDDENKKIEDVKSSVSFSSLETNLTLNSIKDNSNENIKEINDSSDKDMNKKINNKLPLNENINHIFNLFKNLILIGNKELLELLFDDECYLITFGAFEHDIQSNKIVPHRKYFKEIVKFKNPLNIKDQNLLKKINQNIRLTYLRDTAFSRLIDDNTNKTINTIIQNNHSDIIQFFINNKEYLELLFSQLKSEDIQIQKDAVLFLSELISCSKNVVQSKITFNELLCANGILPILSELIEDIPNNIINNKNNPIKELININAVEIFISILSAVPLLIRQYLMENDGRMLQQLTNVLLYHNNFGVKYEVSQIFKTLIESNGEPYDKKIFFNNTIEKFISFLITPKLENKNDNSSTIQIIIEIFMAWINNMGFDSEFWLEKHQINIVIIKLLKEKNKIVNLYTIKLLKIIVENSEHYISIKILTNELCKLIIDLFKQNMKKNNIISSCLMNFLDSISQNNNYILNVIMNYSSDFFYNNKDYFKNIILRYERKSTPKKILISYLSINTITESSLKDIDPIFNKSIENYKENEIEQNFEFYEDKFLRDEDEENFDILNENYVFSIHDNSENKIDFLYKKRHLDKNIDDDDEDKLENYDYDIEPLNKRLNNYGGYCFKNLDIFSKEKYKHKHYDGISLKETDDDFYKAYEDEDLF